MKRLFTLLLISFVAMSCETIDEKLDDLLGKKDVVIFADGTELTANVPSKQTVLNYKFESTLDWEVTTDVEWLEIDPMRGKAGKDIKIQIKVHKNKDEKSRTGYVDLVVANNDSYRITIKQAGTKDEENDDVVVDIPHNQIWYTSIDGKIVEPNDPAAFNVNIISNTYIDGKGVIKFDGDLTEVGYMAFYGCVDCVTNCYNLTSFILPQSVTSICEHAFDGCRNLQSVTISDNVTHIGEAAFICCTGLKEFKGKFASDNGRCLIIDGTLNAFAPAGLTEYTIPDSVTTIGDRAFSWCESLTSVTIPDSVTKIGNNAFNGCKSLTSVTIPDSATTIGHGAFAGCENLEAVHITDLVSWCNIDFINPFTDGSIDYSANPLCYAKNLYLNGELVTDLVIPDGVNEIKLMAFLSCESIKSVTIGNGVTTIGDWVFYNCTNLTSVTIGDSVTTIGYAAFYNCGSLTSVTIGDSVTTIGDYAFLQCSSLTSVTIGDSVTTIGHAAFGWCENLEAVHITDLVSWCNIDFINPFTDGRVDFSANPLCYAHNLYLNGELVTDLVIPDGVNEIKLMAFANCISLTSVTIPDSVTTIGYYAFLDCSSLTSVYCKPTTPPAVLFYYDYWGAFYNNAPDRKIYVPMESVEAYKSAEGWSDYADAIVGYNFETGEVDDTEVPEELEEPELSEYTSTDGDIVVP